MKTINRILRQKVKDEGRAYGLDREGLVEERTFELKPIGQEPAM